MLGDKVRTPGKWLGVCKVLTDALATSEMTTRDDIIVQVVDETTPDVATLPIAWHVPATSDIVLNATKIEGMADLVFLSPRDLESKASEYIGRGTHFNLGYEDGQLLDRRYYNDTDRTFARIRGVLVHEAGHTMWSHYLLDGWWREIGDPRLAEIITMLDEVRIEGMQADRQDNYRSALRLSARMLVPGKDVLDDMRAAHAAGMMDMFKVSLNAALFLGRRDQGVLLNYETRELRWLMEDLFGLDRLEHMREIWNEFCEIEDVTDESEHALALAQEWLDLVTDDSGENEMMGLKGLLEMLAEIFGGIGEGVERWAGNDQHWGTAEDMMPAREAAEEVFKPRPCKVKDCPVCSGEKDKSEDPSHGYSRSMSGEFGKRKARPAERQAASALAKRLERLSTPARTETRVRMVTPPGRLKTRAALSQSAARHQGRMSTAEPWETKRRKHHDTPKLTVGVATDVSGSMGWAEDMVASFSWIVNKAVRHVNGNSAAVVFGERAEPILGPGDRLTDMVTTRTASDGSEAVNEGIAALDGMLHLTEPANGVRLLFIVSDGVMVADGQMAAKEKWIKKLVRSGCVVVQISQMNKESMSKRNYHGYDCLSKGSRYVQASTADIGMVNRMADEIVRALEAKTRR